jgi:hypothetical protein
VAAIKLTGALFMEERWRLRERQLIGMSFHDLPGLTRLYLKLRAAEVQGYPADALPSEMIRAILEAESRDERTTDNRPRSSVA